MQHTSSLLGSIIQRGLTKEAHKNGHVENNEFAKINKQCFVYENGKVRIDYPRMILSTGPIYEVVFTQCQSKGLHVNLAYNPCLNSSHAHPDDIVHIYAVEFQVEVCQHVVSVERQSGQVAFELPDLSDETSNPKFYLYAIVEAANTAFVPTLSPDEKKANKSHRNINRRVSPSVYIGTIVVQ